MLNIRSKKIAIFLGVLFFQPLLNSGSFALAKKKSPPKAYSYITEGDKASQGECDGERKIPRKLKHLKTYAKAASYMGSELQSPEIGVKPNVEMWKHLYRDKSACNTALAKTPSAIQDATLKNPKTELPPDDETDDSDTSEDRPEGADPE